MTPHALGRSHGAARGGAKCCQLPEFAIPHRACRGDARIQAVACNLSRVPCACATCERVCRVPSLLFCPCTTAAKIRVKNRDPVPAYAMADADRDSDLGDDSPVILSSAVADRPTAPYPSRQSVPLFCKPLLAVAFNTLA
ncbi:hypothetical protein RR46_06450 [Papilio xuthus]|uniref:Uncharacterized protein n=1 Tax=Papilio xuthus TaxID=66420 RepID=A0A194QCZ8_PAPXU|nr:hypothetical protein RR46_06450 [Papilio xuthus]